MFDSTEKFEKFIVSVLIVSISFVVFLSTIRLIWKIASEMMAPPVFLLNMEQLFIVFDFFLIVLIGLELMESIKAYRAGEKKRVEAILIIALIAVARKVITMEYTQQQLKQVRLLKLF
jgi:uncharacterized membrane protein (DUF373 family)